MQCTSLLFQCKCNSKQSQRRWLWVRRCISECWTSVSRYSQYSCYERESQEIERLVCNYVYVVEVCIHTVLAVSSSETSVSIYQTWMLRECLALLIHNQEVLGLDVGLETDCSEIFMVFLSPFRPMLGLYLKLDYDCFVQHLFQFIMHISFHSMLCT